MLAADLVWPLRDAPSGAFALEDANAPPEQAVVTAVDCPVLLGYAPDRPNGRAMLILGGGGYVALAAHGDEHEVGTRPAPQPAQERLHVAEPAAPLDVEVVHGPAKRAERSGVHPRL